MLAPPAWLHGHLGLTAGQRWSLPIVLGVPLAVLLFGLPPAQPIADTGTPDGATPEVLAEAPNASTGDAGPAGAGAPPVTSVAAPAAGGSAPSSTASAPTAAASAAQPASGGQPAGRPAPPPTTADSGAADAAGPAASTPPEGVQSDGDAAAPGANPPAAADPAPPRVVLLADARAADPGRGDADMAAAYLEDAGLDAEVVVADLTAAETCQQVPADAVVVTSLGVGSDPRGCLADRSAALIGFDDLAVPGDGVVSTSAGVHDSLVDLLRHAADADMLGRTVGVVMAAELSAPVEAALEVLAAQGVEAAVTHVVAEPARDVPQGVLAFADAGVDTVVFALDVAGQRRWVEQSTLLLPGARYLVADARDALVEEGNAPSFDGAVAHTTVRMSWGRRADGPTPEQQRCRSVWEAAALPPVVLSEAELQRAFAWCQHLGLAVRLRDALAGGSAVEQALTDIEASSVISAELGPTPDGAWGPVERVTVRWVAACGCWEPQR